MASIALFHSVLGVRPGIDHAAEQLRSHGHDVRVVDQYDGRVFDDYEPANAYVEEVGFPALMARAFERTQDLPPGFVAAGFSNGGGMAEYVAAKRRDAAGVIMISGALDPAEIGITWPSSVPAQVHSTVDDPRRVQEWIDAVIAAVEGAGAAAEVFDYPGSGHLFADPSKADEYQPDEAELMWSRVNAFLARVAGSQASGYGS
jgi:dienelactone hydrolase